MDLSSPARERQIAGVAALSDPVRRSLYDFVVSQGRDVGRDEAAQVLGVSRNLAAFHLDRLVEEGLLDAIYRRLSGRAGPGAGRPSKLYRRSAQRIEVSLPPRRYEVAARLFAEALADPNAPDVPARLQDVAYGWGEHLGEQARRDMPGPADDADLLRDGRQVLQEYGYEPYEAGNGEMRLRNCPFHELSAQYRQLMCGTNLCLMRGFAAGIGLREVDVVLSPRQGECCVVFR